VFGKVGRRTSSSRLARVTPAGKKKIELALENVYASFNGAETMERMDGMFASVAAIVALHHYAETRDR